jgi:carboxypeptidase C (cathepsin A)
MTLWLSTNLFAQQPSITKSFVTMGGKRLDYTAYTGYLHIKNDTNKAIARIFYTYYKKDNELSKNRPITFTFNGGPGSSSLWLHMGAIGPKRVYLKDDGTATAPPYQIINNEYTWLDKSDLVFLDPVSTGFSRAASGEKPSQFHGYQEDVVAVSNFIRNFLTDYDRWDSAKFLSGESYGTTRAAGLAKYLTQNFRIYINGIFLISPILNFGANDYYVGNDLPRINYLPSFTAAAFYHKKLAPELSSNLEQTLRESEAFAMGEYASALLKGDQLSDSEKNGLATKMSRYTGLSKEFCLQNHLRVTEDRFWKELRRTDGLIIGRLDGRFTGRDLDDGGENVSHDPSFTNIDGPFTSTVNDYIIKDLKFEEENPYNVFGPVNPWNWSSNNKFLNAGEDLRDAMSRNPHLHVYVGSGYYDFATPYFAANYDINHMLLRAEQRQRVKQYYYQSGHMYYINMPDMIKFKKDVDEFYDMALGKK